MIIQCKVLMYDQKMEEVMGEGKGQESWHDCAIDLRDVSAIRRCWDDNKEDLGVCHFKHGDYFIIDVLYTELLFMWQKALKVEAKLVIQ